ncbi:MAG: hypothetical protein OHK0039_45640 [Bacteroidia bacterium]
MRKIWIVWKNMPVLAVLLLTLPVLAQQTEPDIEEFVFVDQEPVAQNLSEVRKTIAYPPAAVERSIEGTVVARILIDTAGRYVRHEIVRMGHPLLSDAVEAHLPDLVFSPAIKDGRPIMYWLNMPFPFKLVDEHEQAIREQVTKLGAEIDRDPANHELFHKRGVQYSKLGEFNRALEDFDESILLNPKLNKKKPVKNTYAYLFYSYYGRGSVHTKQEAYAKALADYNLALQTAAAMKLPDSAVTATLPSVYLERGYVQGVMASYDSARMDLLQVLALSTREDERCAAYELLRDIALASDTLPQDSARNLIEAYDGLIACDPDDAMLYFSRGYYRSQNGNHAGAIEDFAVVAANASRPELVIASWNYTAWSHTQLGALDQAQAAIDEALKVNALNYLSYYYRAQLRLAQGKTEAACEDLRRAMNFGLELNDIDEREAAIALLKASCGGWDE